MTKEKIENGFAMYVIEEKEVFYFLLSFAISMSRLLIDDIKTHTSRSHKLKGAQRLSIHIYILFHDIISSIFF